MESVSLTRLSELLGRVGSLIFLRIRMEVCSFYKFDARVLTNADRQVLSKVGATLSLPSRHLRFLKFFVELHKIPAISYYLVAN